MTDSEHRVLLTTLVFRSKGHHGLQWRCWTEHPYAVKMISRSCKWNKDYWNRFYNSLSTLKVSVTCCFFLIVRVFPQCSVQHSKSWLDEKEKSLQDYQAFIRAREKPNQETFHTLKSPSKTNEKLIYIYEPLQCIWPKIDRKTDSNFYYYIEPC